MHAKVDLWAFPGLPRNPSTAHTGYVGPVYRTRKVVNSAELSPVSLFLFFSFLFWVGLLVCDFCFHRVVAERSRVHAAFLGGKYGKRPVGVLYAWCHIG